MKNHFFKSLLASVALVTLSNCGGSGSSSAPAPIPVAPTPPPAPTNNAPVISISVSDVSPNEGETITIDASESSDADGDTLTFTWSQTSGPAVVLPAGGATFELVVPEVDANAIVVLQIEVSDGEATVFDEISLDVINLNKTPMISYTVSKLDPFEGRMSTLDASESTDPEGEELTYQWTQLSGADLIFSDPNSATTNVTVPNLSESEAARIQLRVSDGTNNETEEVTLTLKNLVLTPAATSTISGEKTFEFSKTIIDIVTKGYFFETLNYLAYVSSGNLVLDTFGYDASNNPTIFSEAAFTMELPEKLEYSGAPDFGPGPIFAAYYANKVDFYEMLLQPANVKVTMNISNPCSMVDDFNRSPGRTVIGTKNGGGKLIGYTLDEFSEPNGAEVILSFGGNSTFCELQYVDRALDEIGAGSEEQLLAFDQDANELVLFTVVRDDDLIITDIIEKETFAIDLDLPEGAQASFVVSKKIEAQANKGMALVYSDGNTEGIHRLVIIGGDGLGSIKQQVYSWNYGVPKGISTAWVDDHGGDSLFITTEDSPYAVIFKSGGFFAGDTPYLPLEGPSYFDLGVGHGLATNIVGGSPRTLGTLVTYPDQNLIKVLERE